MVSPTLCFSCVSEAEEYRELLRDPTSAGVWYFRPAAGLNAGSPDAFRTRAIRSRWPTTVSTAHQTRRRAGIHGQPRHSGDEGRGPGAGILYLPRLGPEAWPPAVPRLRQAIQGHQGGPPGTATAVSATSTSSTSSPAPRPRGCSAARRACQHRASAWPMTAGCSRAQAWRSCGCWMRKSRSRPPGPETLVPYPRCREPVVRIAAASTRRSAPCLRRPPGSAPTLLACYAVMATALTKTIPLSGSRSSCSVSWTACARRASLRRLPLFRWLQNPKRSPAPADGSALVYTLDEAARALRVSRTKLYGLLSTGQLASIKSGRSRKIPASALQDYLDSLGR